jgi:putative NADH-flavin reductase
MKIALLGASGRVGQRITMEALGRGHEVKGWDAIQRAFRLPIHV